MMLTCIMRSLFRNIRPNTNLHIPTHVKDRTLKVIHYFRKDKPIGSYIWFDLFSDLKQSPITLPLAIISVGNISHLSNTSWLNYQECFTRDYVQNFSTQWIKIK